MENLRARDLASRFNGQKMPPTARAHTHTHTRDAFSLFSFSSQLRQNCGSQSGEEVIGGPTSHQKLPGDARGFHGVRPRQKCPGVPGKSQTELQTADCLPTACMLRTVGGKVTPSELKHVMNSLGEKVHMWSTPKKRREAEAGMTGVRGHKRGDRRDDQRG